MIQVRVDNQHRYVVVGPAEAAQHRFQVALAYPDAVLAVRRKPAAVEFLGRDNDVSRLRRGPVEILVNAFFGKPAENGRRNDDDKGQQDQQSNNAFFHENYLFGRSTAADASMRQ